MVQWMLFPITHRVLLENRQRGWRISFLPRYEFGSRFRLVLKGFVVLFAIW